MPDRNEIVADAVFRCSALVLFLVCLAFPASLAAADTALPADTRQKPRNERIQVEAERLVADETARTAVFSGNVRAVQGEARITAESLTIHYTVNDDASPDGDTAGGVMGGKGTIEKIIAQGKVHIHFQDMDAAGARAEYSLAERVLVMTGPGAMVSRRGTGTMRGGVITVYRNDGRIQFDGGVKGEFFSDGRGLN